MCECVGGGETDRQEGERGRTNDREGTGKGTRCKGQSSETQQWGERADLSNRKREGSRGLVNREKSGGKG